MKKVLVTGANGFIGRNLVKHLSSKDNIEIIALARKDEQYFNDMENVQFIESAIENFNLDIGGIDYIYHLAWSGISPHQRNNVDIQKTNEVNTDKMVNYAKKNNVPKFITAGSILEKEYLLGLNNNYARSKFLMREKYTNDSDILYLQPIITNTYGPYECSNRLISSTLRNIYQHKYDKLHFTTGEQLYDFVYITDLCEALYLIGDKGDKHYTIGTGSSNPLKVYLETLNKLILPNYEFVYDMEPTPTSLLLTRRDFKVDNLADLGYSAKVSFEDGILETYKSIVEK